MVSDKKEKAKLCICIVWLFTKKNKNKNPGPPKWSSPCFLLDFIFCNSPPCLILITILTFSPMLEPPKHAVTSESLHGLFPLPAMLFLRGPAWLASLPPPGRPSLDLTVKQQPLTLGVSHPLTFFPPTVFITTQQTLCFSCIFVYCFSSPSLKVNSSGSVVWSVFFRFCF